MRNHRIIESDVTYKAIEFNSQTKMKTIEVEAAGADPVLGMNISRSQSPEDFSLYCRFSHSFAQGIHSQGMTSCHYQKVGHGLSQTLSPSLGLCVHSLVNVWLSVFLLDIIWEQAGCQENVWCFRSWHMVEQCLSHSRIQVILLCNTVGWKCNCNWPEANLVHLESKIIQGYRC